MYNNIEVQIASATKYQLFALIAKNSYFYIVQIEYIYLFFT